LALGHTLVVVHRAGTVRSLDLRRLAEGKPADECKLGSVVRLSLPPSAEPTGVVHPPSWLNKVLVSGSDGRFRVVNLRSGSVVFQSEPVAASADAADAAAGVKTSQSSSSSSSGGSSLAALVAARSRGDDEGDDSDAEAAAAAPPATSGVPVTSMLALPAPNMVAFGLEDGRVLLHNCRADRTAAVFRHAPASGAAASPVTALAFCTDPGRPARLASATSSGEVALWDLPKRRLVWARPAAHAAAVTGMLFLPSSPLLVTCGADNAMRQWVLDGLDEAPSLLRHREGHFGGVAVVRFAHRNPTEAAGPDGADARLQEAVTAGSDRRLRLTHCAVGLERQDRELSQGKGMEARARRTGAAPAAVGGGEEGRALRALGGAALLRLPAVTRLAVSDRREGQWSGIVTAHRGLGAAYIWDWSAKTLADRVMVLPGRAERGGAGGGEEVVSVAISACGGFAVLGGSRGTVARFNLQTGAPRGCYPASTRRHRAIAMRGRKRGPAQADGTGTGGDGGVAGDLGSSRRRRGEDEARGSAADPAAADASVAYLMGSRGATSAKVDETAEGKAAAGVGGVVPAHAGSVAGIVIDGLNRHVVTGGQDGRCRWWGFDSHLPSDSVDLGAGVTGMGIHRPSGLVAVALETGGVHLLDVESRRVVRSFPAPPRVAGGEPASPSAAPASNRVTDMTFTPDGRTLVVAHADGSVRALDIPAARVADWLWFRHTVVSLDVSPAGDSLVTASRGRAGVSVLSCRAFFEAVHPAAPPTRPVLMDEPMVDADEEGGIGGSDGDDDDVNYDAASSDGDDDDEEATSELRAKRSRPAGRRLLPVELSGLPASRFESLPHLDSIRDRSRPLEAPKAPEAAPFFLPTAQGLSTSFGPAGSAALPPSTTASSAVSSSASMDAAASFFSGNDATADAAAGAGRPSSSSSPVRGLLAALLDAIAASATSSLGPESTLPPAPPAGSEEEERMGHAALSRAAGLDASDEEDDDDEDEDGADDGGLDSLLRDAARLHIADASTPADILAAAAMGFKAADAAAWCAAVVAPRRAVSAGALALLRGVSPLLAARTLQHLATLTPARADAAVTSLCMGHVDLPGRARLLALLRVLALAVVTRRWMDVSQAHVGLLLRAHGDVVAASPELRRAAQLLEPEQASAAAAATGVVDQLAGMARWIVRAV